MSVAFTPAAEGLPRRAFTVEDIRRMIDAGIVGEHERFELIEGDIVMLGHNLAAHEVTKNVLSTGMVRAAPSELLVGVATTLQLADNILVDADLTIVRRAGYKPSESGFAQPRPDDVLLIIEIAGPNARYDRDVKARLYARYGVERVLVDRAIRPDHMDSHQPIRRRMVVNRRAPPERATHDAGAARFRNQAGRDRLVTPPLPVRARAAG